MRVTNNLFNTTTGGGTAEFNNDDSSSRHSMNSNSNNLSTVNGVQGGTQSRRKQVNPRKLQHKLVQAKQPSSNKLTTSPKL